MDGCNVPVAKEVCFVQREEVGDTVDPHCRDQAGVVDLCARNSVGKDQSAPFAVDPLVIR